MSAFTLWTEKALLRVRVTPPDVDGFVFGVAYSSEIWFHAVENRLACHTWSAYTGALDATAIMERRNS